MAGPARIRAVLYIAAVLGTRYAYTSKLFYERLLARGQSKMSSLGVANAQAGAFVFLCTQKSTDISTRLLYFKDGNYRAIEASNAM